MSQIKPDRVVLLDVSQHQLPVEWSHNYAPAVERGFKYSWFLLPTVPEDINKEDPLLVSQANRKYVHGELLFLRRLPGELVDCSDGRGPVYEVIEVEENDDI